MLRDKRHRRRRKRSRWYHHARQRRKIFQRSRHSRRRDTEKSQDTRVTDRSGRLDQCSHPEEPRRSQAVMRNEEYDGDRPGPPLLPPNDLQQCIADICTWKKKPVLNIVDAYRMMHQNGPQGKSAADVATLKSMIVSPNIVAVDTAALALFNQVKKLDMAAVGHLSKGEALKLGSTDLKKINIKRIKI
ncbi:DUF362 domain-containing protein [Parabacteroides merdae]|nr:DUF362 domain-containing protein [Parabacteroides merdae]